MKSETIQIRQGASGRVEFSRMIISLRYATSSTCEAVVGYPGLPNVSKELRNGDAVLYETPDEGVLEARLVSVANQAAEFMITQVSPRAGLLAGATDSDPNNSPFSEQELGRIAESISEIKTNLRSTNLLPDQLELLGRKLDEIQRDAKRMGRKDWMNCVAGSLGGVCASAAFPPEATKTVFQIVNSAFTWLFTNAWFLIA